jgi:hypothetical protein
MLKLFRAELDKYLLEVKTYYPDQIVDMVVKYILFATFFMALSIMYGIQLPIVWPICIGLLRLASSRNCQ